MIVKMKFINISGPRDDIDRVMDLYLSRYEIQLESALTELKTVENLRPFVEINPYRDALLKAQQYVSYLNEPEKIAPDTSMGLDDIFELIRATNEEYLTFQARKDVLKRKQDELQAKQKVIEPFRPMDGDLGRILSFRYITCRFGKLPAEQYHWEPFSSKGSRMRQACTALTSCPPGRHRRWMLCSVPCILRGSIFRQSTEELQSRPAVSWRSRSMTSRKRWTI